MTDAFEPALVAEFLVADLDLLAAGVDLFMQPESKWYRMGDDMEVGVRQFLVQDPDGYLVRFQSSLGRRAAER